MSTPWVIALIVLGGAWVMAMSIIIVMQRRSAAATIAWLLVLAFVPILGLVVYGFIGPLRLERKKRRFRTSRQVAREALDALATIDADSSDPDVAELALVPVSSGESPPLPATAVEIFLDGDSAYAAIGAAIAAATQHVHVEYYIWEPDVTGTWLRDALIAKAKEGVTVRVLLDGLGSWSLSSAFLAPLVAAGAEVAWFNPLRLRLRGFRRKDFRTHRKIVVCDGRVAFTGGMNVSDVHSGVRVGTVAWRDTHLGFSGTATRALQRVFLDDWVFASERAAPREPELFPPPGVAGPDVVQIVASGPDSTRIAIHRTVFAAINAASRRLWITTPYFVPDEAISAALVTAALRRADVRILVPRRGDSRLVDLAARSYFPELLEAGVRIFEYTTRVVHAKTLVADEVISIVGSANLDNRSFRLNFEVCAVLYGAAPNATLARAFEEDLGDAHELTAAELAKAPFLARLGQAGARLLSPLL